MKKPEKKTNKEHTNLTKTFGGGKILTQKAIGYNQAIDEYEKYHTQEIVSHMKAIGKLTKQLVNLPSEEDILLLTEEYTNKFENRTGDYLGDKWITLGGRDELAKAISERIRGTQKD